ncbi:hypothetical protein VTK56DRAFT_7492 [Thermocarpiscus australiensis]
MMDMMRPRGGPLPFGYGINSSPRQFAEEPQDPPVPVGAELLDNNDRKYLSNFFEGVSNGYETAGLGDGLGAVFTDNWRFPPELVAHNVSYGTAVDGLVQAAFPNLADMPAQADLVLPGMPPQDPQHFLGDLQPSADVLSAATALSRSSGAQFDMRIPTAIGRSAGPAQQQGFRGSGGGASRLPSNANNFNAFNHGMFGSVAAGESYTRRPHPPTEEVRFGTDPNFDRVNFVARSEKETTEAMMAYQLSTLNCLKRDDSAAPTRAPSPSLWAPLSPHETSESLLSPATLQTLTHLPLTPDELENGDSGRPRKRRKSGGENANEESERASSPSAPADQVNSHAHPNSETSREATTTLTRPASRRRKPPGPLTPEPEAAAAAAGGGKRRRSAGANGKAAGAKSATKPKAPRENLTEEQKRENHIKSEQKRRDIIKVGFDYLRAIVPSIRGGDHSRAAVLNMTADWLEELVAGNQKLREMLAAQDEPAAAAA